VSQATPKDEGWDWPWLKYLGTVILHKSENEFWRSTPRELDALWRKHQERMGWTKQQPQMAFIDEVLPL
jgi:hypothetical protein